MANASTAQISIYISNFPECTLTRTHQGILRNQHKLFATCTSASMVNHVKRTSVYRPGLRTRVVHGLS